MQRSIGESIRQLRRQRGLTQTELGTDHFSKSYVSAVEREKIVPSHEALRFFAEQLDQPIASFEHLLLQSEQEKQASTQRELLFISQQNDSGDQDEALALLDVVLEGTELPDTPFSQEISALPNEVILNFPLQKQARYFFLKGLLFQEHNDLQNARLLLERALALSPVKHQPAILDALGVNSSIAHIWQAALSYHQRALHLMDADGSDRKTPTLLLNVELHCGNAFHALGAHRDALEHYERARQYLRSTSNMKIAGQVYLGLGYCTYALIYQVTAPTQFSYEEKERLFQRAMSFLLQSRTLYQVSSDRMEESKVRLLHATILLDFCTLRYQAALERTQKTGTVTSAQCTTLLDEAEEQCHQVLLSWGEASLDTGIASSELEAVSYTALSSLVRVFTMRAAVARMEGYTDTALRERAHAAHLCNLILDTLATSDIPWSLTRDAMGLEDPDMYRLQALPHLPDSTKSMQFQSLTSLAAIFFAAGEVAEELGRVATNREYASDCYTRADECFKAALSMQRQSTHYKEHDPSYLMRSYQRCIALMEERIQVAHVEAEETYQTVLVLFKDVLYQPLHVLSYN